MDSTTFELLLSPELLAQRLPSMSQPDILDQLKTFLSLLVAEKSKNAANAPAQPTTGPASDDVEVLQIAEGNNEEGAQNGKEEATAGSRKQAVMQMMCIQLAGQLEWNMALLNSKMTINLQHQLIDCLLSASKMHKTVNEANNADNVESLAEQISGSYVRVFAATLFFRWVLRSAASLNLPLPVGNKAQIYSALPKAILPVIGNSEHGPVYDYVMSMTGAATKVLLTLEEKVSEFRKPTAQAVQIVSEASASLVAEDKLWRKQAKPEWAGLVKLDMALYHLYFEQYRLLDKNVKALKGLEKHVASEDQKKLEGLMKAMDSTVASLPTFQPTIPGDDESHMLKLVKGNSIPNYYRLNYELAARGNSSTVAKDLMRENVSHRIKASYSLNYEGFREKVAVPRKTKKEKMLAALVNMDYGSEWTSTKPNITSKLNENFKTKLGEVKKRQTASIALREVKASKLPKVVLDLQKMPMLMNRLSSRLSIGDGFAQDFLQTLPPGSNDANLVWLSLCKVNQLNAIGADAEANQLCQQLEKFDKSMGNANHPFKTYQRRLFGAQMTRRLRRRGPVMTDEQMKCRQMLLDLRNISPKESLVALESALAALVNTGDWDFVTTIKEPRWMLLQVVQIAISLAIYIKNGNITLDIKKNCQLLQELLKPVLLSPSNTKRGRDIPIPIDESKSTLLDFFAKLYHPDILQIFCTLLATLYNETVEDSSCRINHDFPVLPFSSATLQQSDGLSLVSTAELLSMFRGLVDRGDRFDASWVRLQGETHFALANHGKALRYDIEAMVLYTNYFLKVHFNTEWEEKLIPKMVKCLLELGYHSYVIGIGQFVQDVDYSVSFKNLEERHCNDAMDGIFQNIWDVTVLEYAVSMHAKRGEHARRKKALGNIGALEINTNNNVEILRETSNFKRFSFMRILCTNFL